MNKAQKITLVASMVIGLLILSTAFLISNNKNQKNNQPSGATPDRLITSAELAKADGKDGHDCYVAVDGIVYLIKDFSLWDSKGQHKTSGGQAYCGADMSKVIDKAPHGRKMLDILPKTGTLVR